MTLLLQIKIVFQRCNDSDSSYVLRNRETDLKLRQTKKEFLKRSFRCNGAIHWNNLPIDPKRADSINLLKRNVKSAAR